MPRARNLYPPMLPGRCYHVFNRGNAGANIFYQQRNHVYFLRKCEYYLAPVLDTYCYSLLPNHFHLLVRVKDEATVLEHFARSKSGTRGSGDGIRGNRDGIPKPSADLARDAVPAPGAVPAAARWVSERFRRLFISYSQAIIKQEKLPPGSLFQKNFKRTEVDSESYFWNLVLYIHTNAQLHGWHTDFRDHKHNSYHSLLHAEPGGNVRNEVVSWFGGPRAFELAHLQRADLEIIEELLIEEDPFIT